MYNLVLFRERVRALYRRANPYHGRPPNQRDLAAAIGLNYTELSSRLSGSPRTKLTHRDVREIVRTLADWGAISTRAQALELLQLVDCPDFTAAEWQSPPLSQLRLAGTVVAVHDVTLLSATAHLGNIPHQINNFIGRKQELAALGELMAAHRLITLVGPGGSGKTSLALALAAQTQAHFAAGAWLVELAEVRDSQTLGTVIAQVLGVREQLGQPSSATLAAYLHDKQLLLVIDNCEHLIASLAPLVLALLHDCPQLHIIATSREALHLAGELAWPVPTLSLPEHPSAVVSELLRYEAIQLFVERAITAYPTFQLTRSNAAAVLEICTRLDGIPLALELAAARVQVLSVRQIADRLGERFRLLGGHNYLPLRQQTLRALFDWSYELLTPSERWLFRRLAVFAAGFSLEAVATIAEGDVLTTFTSVLDKSLLRSIQSSDELPRFAMLETVREYARLQIAASGEELAWREHAAYYTVLAAQAEPELRGANQALWLARLAAEHDNLRTALANLLEHEDGEAALQLATSIWRFWYVRSYISEGLRWLAAAIEAAPAASLALLAKATSALGILSYEAGDQEEAKRQCVRSLTLYRQLDDIPGQATTISSLAALSIDTGDYAAAEALFREGLALRRQMGDNWAIALSLHNIAVVLALQGRFADSSEYAQEALQLRQELGDRRGMATSLGVLGHMALRLGDIETARQYCEQSLSLAAELDDRRTTAIARHILGIVAQRQGDWEAAEEWYIQSLAIHLEMDDRRGMAEYLEEVASLAIERGQYQRATEALAMAAVLREQSGMPMPSYEEVEYNHKLQKLKQQLGNGTFSQMWSATKQQGVEHIIATLATYSNKGH